MRMSLARARARPPPAAGPFTAAITGWGRERNRGTSAAMCGLRGEGGPDAVEALGPGRGAVAGEVEPGAEAPAGAGEDDHPACRVRRRRRQRFVELGDQRRVHGVQAVRAVERDPGDALVRLVDLQCVHGGIPPLGSAISCNRRPATSAAPGREQTWVCGTRASSTLRWPRSSPGTSGPGRCRASCRPGNRSRSSRRRRPWPTGRRSCACPGVCAGWRSTPMTTRRTGSWTSWSRCRCSGVTRTPSRPSTLSTARDPGHRPRRHARAGLVPPADLPLPASPAGRRPGRAPEYPATGRPPPTVAVTGSSGLIGSALCAYLSTGGHRVIRLVRRPPRHALERAWIPERPDPRALDGVDAVVHLAGASIAGRFTDAHKRRVRDSRVGPTAALARVMADLHGGPRLLLCASAIGYYGADRGDEELTEESGRGSGFLAELVEDWEAATAPATRRGPACRPRADGHCAVRPRGQPEAPPPAVRGWARGPTRARIAVGVVDRPRRPARCLRAGAGGRHAGRTAQRRRPIPSPTVSTSRPWPASCGARRCSPSRRLGPRLLLGAEGAREMVQASQRVAPGPAGAAGHVFRHPALEAVCGTSWATSTRRRGGDRQAVARGTGRAPSVMLARRAGAASSP